MKTSQKFVLCASMMLSAVSGQALAASTDSNGETSPILACFYDCKSGPGVRTDSWQEVTTIKLINEATADRDATVTILNSNEIAIAYFVTRLSPLDLDEINICRTLYTGGITPPTTGLIQISVKDTQTSPAPATGVYAWMKNWLGKFMVTADQPSGGYLDHGSVSKTECRVVPPSLGTSIPTTIPVTPVYVDGTGDLPN